MNLYNFTVYKITNDKNFYLKNKINGKILESAISVECYN